MDEFWTNHNSAYPSSSPQYASNIFYHNDEQKILATRSKEKRQRLTEKTLSTGIKQFDNFFLAEMYHQKYYLKLDDQITSEVRVIYPDPYALTNSTSAARINGFLGGSGEKAYMEGIIGSLGLSPQSIEIIRSHFNN